MSETGRNIKIIFEFLVLKDFGKLSTFVEKRKNFRVVDWKKLAKLKPKRNGTFSLDLEVKYIN